LARSRWCAPREDAPRFRGTPQVHTGCVLGPRLPQVRQAPCGLARHPAVLGPPQKHLGHEHYTLIRRCLAGRTSFGGSPARSTEDSPDGGEHF
jgi:hypothetical protein